MSKTKFKKDYYAEVSGDFNMEKEKEKERISTDHALYLVSTLDLPYTISCISGHYCCSITDEHGEEISRSDCYSTFSDAIMSALHVLGRDEDTFKTLTGLKKQESEITILPDGSAFSVISLPLPDDHWLFAEPESGYEKPPMPMRIGTDDPRRSEMKEMLQQAGRYAIRAVTSNGEIDDFDPDALIQNLIIGMLGYNTSDGVSSCDP